MTLVWLSPGLPADRAELAAALPPGVTLVPAADAHPLWAPHPTGQSTAPGQNAAADVGVLPVGSLCVATVFETDLLAQLAHRPAGVGLLVIGPQDATGVTAAGSVAELTAAITQAIAIPDTTSSTTATAASGAIPFTAGADREKARTPLRSRLIAAGAVALGLAIGGVVIASTEGTSAATAGGGGGFGGGGFTGQLPGGTGTGGTGGTGGTLPGGPGTQGGTGTGRGLAGAQQEILACLRQQGITTPTSQLLQNTNDPKLRQAFLTCIQQLRGGAAGTSSPTTGRP